MGRRSASLMAPSLGIKAMRIIPKGAGHLLSFSVRLRKCAKPWRSGSGRASNSRKCQLSAPMAFRGFMRCRTDRASGPVIAGKVPGGNKGRSGPWYQKRFQWEMRAENLPCNEEGGPTISMLQLSVRKHRTPFYVPIKPPWVRRPLFPAPSSPRLSAFGG